MATSRFNFNKTKPYKWYSLKQLSELTGVNRITLSQYAKAGIIWPDPESAYPIYSGDMVKRIKAHHRPRPRRFVGDQPDAEDVAAS